MPAWLKAWQADQDLSIQPALPREDQFVLR
jgi:hypothetical protein